MYNIITLKVNFLYMKFLHTPNFNWVTSIGTFVFDKDWIYECEWKDYEVKVMEMIWAKKIEEKKAKKAKKEVTE